MSFSRGGTLETDHRRVGAELPQPRRPAAGAVLGGMLSDGPQYVTEAPWLAVVLSLAVFAFNLVGDALHDHPDPRMKR